MARHEIPLCQHVKANGHLCESPALRGEDLCYFHRSVRVRTLRQRRAQRHNLPFQLPLLEDPESIQLAIGETLNALVAGQIDHKTAGLLLYGLQTAATNVRHTRFDIFDSTRRFNQYTSAEEDTLEEEIADEIRHEHRAAKRKAQRETARIAAATAESAEKPATPTATVTVTPATPTAIAMDNSAPLPPKKEAARNSLRAAATQALKGS